MRREVQGWKRLILREKVMENKAHGLVGHYTEYLSSSRLSSRFYINEDESRLG